MAKLRIKQSVALLTAALLLAAPFNHGSKASASGTSSSSSIADIISSNKSILPPSMSSILEAKDSIGIATVDPEINTSSTDKINVIVQLSSQPVSVAQYSAGLTRSSFSAQSTESAIKKEQSSFVSSASSKGISMTVNYQYDTVLNGMEVTVSASDIPKLALMYGVKAISKNRNYYPVPMEASPIYGANGSEINYDTEPLEQIGADDAWAGGFTGKGMKVGVIDTGVDYLHPDLKDAYKGGYDSINRDDDPYEDEPDISFGFVGSDHGTHVSGTIVGRATNTTDEMVQKGVAYEADLYVYKVLGKKWNPDKYVFDVTGSSAQVIDGIEHAVKDHMDVINMSLGSDMVKNPDSPDSIAVNNAVLSGVTAVIANGNAGADGLYYYSMGSPASAQLGISVAAATSTSSHFSGSFTDSLSVNQAVYSLEVMAWETGGSNFNEVLGSEPLDAVYVGLGDDGDYMDKDVHGKVVLISRGVLNFVDKVAKAKANGAKAAIIFNGNVAKDSTTAADLSEHIADRDGPIGPIAFLGENYEFMPTFDMSGYEGRALARLITDPANADVPLQFTFGPFNETIVPGDTIADFSSRGPNSDGNYSIKPDLTAPGVNIRSTWPAYGEKDYGYGIAHYDKAYNRISGTSMATPHIAGLALLLKQEHRDWSPRDIRAALANTADSLSTLDGTQQYDVYSQGAGRANVANAILTPAIVQAMDPITIYDAKMTPKVMESEASSLSFGAISPGEEPISKPLRLKNTSDEALTYAVSVVMHPNVTSDPSDPIVTPSADNIELTLGGLDTDSSNTITVGAQTSHPFTLAAKAKTEAIHGVYEGEIKLEHDGLPTLHLPFVIHVGDDVADNDFALQNLSLTSTTISPDAPIDINVTLANGNVNFLDVEIFNFDEEFVGRLSDFLDLDVAANKLNTIAPGSITFEQIDGSFIDGELDEYGNDLVKQLPEGIYHLEVIAAHFDDMLNVDFAQSSSATVYVKLQSDTGETPTEPGPEPSPEPDPGTPAGGGSTGVPVTDKPMDSEVVKSILQSNQTLSSITGEATKQGDQTVVTVTEAELQKALDAAKASPTVFNISAASTEASPTKVRLSLTAAQVKLLKSASEQGSIALTWSDATVALPLSVLSGFAENTGLILTISPSADSKSLFTAKYPTATVLGTPYTFEAFSIVNGVETQVSLKPDQSVSRAFLLDQSIDASSAGVLYAEGNQVYPTPSRFTKTTNGKTIVTIIRPGFSDYAVVTREISFTDIQASWAAGPIQSLADKFIVNGTSATKFSPKKPVTRAEFATMLVNAIGLDKQSSTSSFTDIKGTEWFAEDVATAYKAGLITGNGGKFKPNDPITRQDLTVMLARAATMLHISKTSGTPIKPYADASKFGAYAQDSIQAVTDAGLMQGVEKQGRLFFDPILSTTREAAAKVLYQLLDAANLI
ncbi:S8 family serine peptidase [Cohnella lupini]|uniref:S-layer family protein n=1 Tax=Cohnella lupini TaxID=1294267 RepID=A0A3D9HTJ8_9BACL|nr:S8 family serine peptidase [Cohnella lupini]RED52828.1 S-layer family protein [Cohnella lupini]